ncbi:MAG: NAD-dependent epimerase/dehydratase family protein [Pseudonocardia sp.]
MKIVVTGASGNVGTGVLRALATDMPDAEIAGVCRRPPRGVPPYDRVTWHRVDLAAADAATTLQLALRDADALVHLAWAIQPVRAGEQLHRTNVGGTRAVLRAAAAAGVDRIVYASSLGVCAPGATKPVDERWPDSGQRTSVYSRHKVEVERVLDRFEREHPGVAVARIRPTLVVQRVAATEIRGLFLGPLVPRPVLALLRRRVLPVSRCRPVSRCSSCTPTTSGTPSCGSCSGGRPGRSTSRPTRWAPSGSPACWGPGRCRSGTAPSGGWCRPCSPPAPCPCHPGGSTSRSTHR